MIFDDTRIILASSDLGDTEFLQCSGQPWAARGIDLAGITGCISDRRGLGSGWRVFEPGCLEAERTRNLGSATTDRTIDRNATLLLKTLGRGHGRRSKHRGRLGRKMSLLGQKRLPLQDPLTLRYTITPP